MNTYETSKGVDTYIKMCEGFDSSMFKNNILKYVSGQKTMLEIGMGPGNDFEWLKELFTLTGSDYSDEFIKRAKIRFPKSDIITLDGIKMDINRTFDSIYSSKVYQHIDLDTLKNIFTRQWEILNKNGLIIHSFWIGGTESDYEDMHFYYHDKEKLLKAISERFTILDSIIYEEFEKNDSLFIIAIKKDS